MEETPLRPFCLARDADRFGERFSLGIGVVCFKVSTADANGDLLVVELVHHEKGGPGRHLHYQQEEWFYIVAGEYILEVAEERFRCRAGDSLFVPRRVPHAWAYAGGEPGRLLLTFTPTGPTEGFFRETSKANAMPPQDPAFFRAHGMEPLGPPLPIE